MSHTNMTIIDIGPLYVGTDPRFDLSIHLGRFVVQLDWSPTNHGPTEETTYRCESGEDTQRN